MRPRLLERRFLFIPLLAILALPVLGQDDDGRLPRVVSDFTFPLVGAGVLGLWAMGDERDEQTARRAVDGLISTALAVEGLRAVVSSSRPGNPADDDGFPSGHTAVAFCAATVLAEREPDIRPWAYLWAASVGWSRVELDAHTWTQALAGAALGYFLGREAAHGRGVLGELIVGEDAPPALSRLTPSGAKPIRGLELGLLRVTW